MGAFLAGLFDKVGPRLKEKHDQEVALQTQKKQGEYGTYWNSMQSAATRLSQLKSKGDGLTDEEKKEAQSLASQYAWSEQQLTKLTKSSKPLAEGLQKVGGFVKQILTHPSPKGKLQAPGDPQQQQQGGDPQSAAPAGQSAAPAGQPKDQQGAASPAGGPLQPPAAPAQGSTPVLSAGKLQPPPAEQPSMQGAMALAQQQNPKYQAEEMAGQERKRRESLIKSDPEFSKLSAREKAEFIESGKMPTAPASQRPTALGLLQQAQSMVDDPEASEVDKKAGQAYIDSHKKTEKKSNYQVGTAVYPDDKPGADPHIVRVNPQDPKDVIDGDTGEPVPKGFHLLNQGVIMQKMRQDSYGTYGQYYRALKNQGVEEQKARDQAAEMLFQDRGIRLERQEQQIAIDASLSGIDPKVPSVGAAKPSTPSPTPGTPKPTASAPSAPKAPASSADQEDMTLYLSSILGVAPKVGGKASGVRALQGQKALAKLTGLSPMELSTELAGDKATAKALSQAVEVAGAFGRVQETLKEHGKVLVDAATAMGPGNVPLGNRTYQWLQDNLKAHPELTKYTLALNAVQREYARMVSGGVQSRAMLPVSSVEKGEAVLRRDATLADIKAAVEQLKIEADTEQKAFGEQIDSLKNKLKGGKIGAATSGQPSPRGKLAPPAANEDLKKVSTEELLKRLGGN